MRWSVFFHKTEVLVWLLFLGACAAFGYFQGVRPDFRISETLLSPTPIQILTISESFFPPDIVTELEHETHTKIQIKTVTSWDDLKLKVISDPSPELLFIPAPWAQSLRQEELLNQDIDFQGSFTELLDSDFNLPGESLEKTDRRDFLPIYWAKLVLRENSKSQEDGVDFLNDSDLFVQYVEHLKKSEKTQDFLDQEFSIFNLNRWFSSDTSAKTYFMTTHVIAAQHPEWTAPNYPEAMYILGFAFPKNIHHVKKSLKLINHYASFEVQKPFLESAPFASTLKSVSESSLPETKKSSYIRSLQMSQVILIKSKEKGDEEKAQVLSKQNFTL